LAIHKLTDAKIRNAGPGTYQDGEGLELIVKDTGAASWKQRFTFNGQRTRVGLGPYPQISLATARTRSTDVKRDIAHGIDPRKKVAVERIETFAEATAYLFELKRPSLKGEGTAGRWMSAIDKHVLPHIGAKDVATITLQDVLKVMRPIWAQDLGRKTLPKIAAIMENARGRDPRVLADVESLAKAQLPQVRRQNVNHPALPWRDMPDLWLSLGDDVPSLSFKFYLLNIPRVANVTHSKWGEVTKSEDGFHVWDIPPENMKTGEPFAAPLTRQSLQILKQAKKLDSPQGYVFPFPESFKKGIVSENRWANMLKDANWIATCGRIAVPHGFRATFATWCGDKQICDITMQKRCIQHKVENKNDAAYLRSVLLPPRLEVMQQWADFITSGEKRRAASAKFHAEMQEIVTDDGRTHNDIELELRQTREEALEAAEIERHAKEEQKQLHRAHGGEDE
jgi:integrase